MGANTETAQGTEVAEHRTDKTVLTESGETGRRLALGVGTFIVSGAGFIFTLFFVNQFMGNAASGFASSIIGGVGVTIGFAFSILLSPLIAMFVGVLIGREGGPRAVVDAGIGSALGFIVMFFVTLVLAAGLGGGLSSASTSIVGAGPLLGFTIGVGLTGAAAAYVGTSGASLLDSATDHSFAEPVSFGIGLFTVFGLGFAVTVFLAASLASTDTGLGLGNLGFGGVTVALGLSLMVSPLLGVILGRFIAEDDMEDEPTRTAMAGGLASGLGFVAMLIVLYILVLILQPENVQAGDFPLGPLLGFVVGVGLTGAASSFVSARQ